MKKKSRLEKIYYYKLYSLKRFPKFLKKSLATAKSIVAAENVMYGRRRGLIYTILDMVWCNLRYGAMDSRDYLLFEFSIIFCLNFGKRVPAKGISSLPNVDILG